MANSIADLLIIHCSTDWQTLNTRLQISRFSSASRQRTSRRDSRQHLALPSIFVKVRRLYKAYTPYHWTHAACYIDQMRNWPKPVTIEGLGLCRKGDLCLTGAIVITSISAIHPVLRRERYGVGVKGIQYLFSMRLDLRPDAGKRKSDVRSAIYARNRIESGGPCPLNSLGPR